MPTILRPAGSIPTAGKPLVRRPTLTRKHDEIDDRLSTAPIKRAKVKFDENIDVKDLQEWEKVPELVQEEVRRALQMHSIGDNSGYDEIKSIFRVGVKGEAECSSNTLKSYTNALLRNIASLDKSCSDLVHAILNSAWVNQADEYINLYVRLLANLVSAHGSFLPDVLNMMVQNLVSGELCLPRRPTPNADGVSSQIFEKQLG